MSRIQAFLGQLTPDEIIDRLDLALEGTGLGIWDWDLRDNSVHFDRRWCEMLGLVHADTTMHFDTWSVRVHADDLAACQRDIQAHLDGLTDRYENVHRMRHADGHWVWILTRGGISGRDAQGQPIRFTGTHLDVTVREEARRLRERHTAQLQQLVAHLPSAVALLDPGLRVLALSPDWPGVGEADPHTVGAPYASVRMAGAPTVDEARVALAGTRLTRDEVSVGTDDQPRFARWVCQPWGAADGSIGGVQIAWTDITDEVLRQRREAEEQDARVASLAMFAGGLAHELNTPLQVIVLASEVLASELDKDAPDPERMAVSVQTIRQTASRAGRITRALRSLSRDARDDPPAAVAVADVFEHVDALCRTRAQSAGVSLVVHKPGQALTVLGREAELVHVLLNLVNNATQACAGRPEARIELTAQAEPGAVVLACADNGPGVRDEVAQAIFEPWFSTKPAGVGTGLGLAIARRLAQRDGGQLSLEPSSVGARFALRLPAAGGS